MRLRVFGSALALVSALTSSLGAQARQTAPPKPTPAATPAPAAAVAATDLAVTVTYTGKGVVDATHNIIVFLFASTPIGPNSQPIGPPQIVTKSGATVTFKDVTAKAVYPLAIYNDKGAYDGRNGPPPAGTPIGTYMKAPSTTPSPATPGSKTPIKLTFDGSKRWGQ